MLTYQRTNAAIIPLFRQITENQEKPKPQTILESRLRFRGRMLRDMKKLSECPERSLVSPRDARIFYGSALLRWVPTRLVTRTLATQVHARGRPVWLRDRFIDAGDWSEISKPVADSFHHQWFNDLVWSGAPTTSPSYRRLLRLMEAGRPMQVGPLVLDSVEAIESYRRYCESLLDSIRTHGVTPRELTPDFTPARGRDPRSERTEGDIIVAVGPGGEFYRMLAGRHRICAAQALGLDHVPVSIRLAHATWLWVLADRYDVPPHQAFACWLDTFEPVHVSAVGKIKTQLVAWALCIPGLAEAWLGTTEALQAAIV
ncbi:hypothetical protein FFK22_032655 [Mycobacterium sp. KBS0706]|uniref:hypothetical protein n=1 Tax=Mycobacterium sp. KBS0706 TaxID=2578109 RepID=UPI00110FE151|nr:hypothetical protein [Mycobacterium sp. KBS0706]TSD84424.1 hypothetical protein FFK22_032655 [Mycobacterium sp. KBS0706]